MVHYLHQWLGWWDRLHLYLDCGWHQREMTEGNWCIKWQGYLWQGSQKDRGMAWHKSPNVQWRQMQGVTPGMEYNPIHQEKLGTNCLGGNPTERTWGSWCTSRTQGSNASSQQQTVTIEGTTGKDQSPLTNNKPTSRTPLPSLLLHLRYQHICESPMKGGTKKLEGWSIQHVGKD